MEETTFAPEIAIDPAETETLNLLDSGIAPKNIHLAPLSHDTLVSRLRQGNLAWFAMHEAGNLRAASDVDVEVEEFLGELESRQAQERKPGRLASFIGRSLPFNKRQQ